VRIAQVSNGQDEMFLISGEDGVTVVDFRQTAASDKPLLKKEVLAGLAAGHEAIETSVR
jgi:hypothetical protein